MRLWNEASRATSDRIVQGPSAAASSTQGESITVKMACKTRGIIDGEIVMRRKAADQGLSRRAARLRSDAAEGESRPLHLLTTCPSASLLLRVEEGLRPIAEHTTAIPVRRG